MHQLGIGFVLRGGLDVYVRKEGMEQKMEWVYGRQVGEVNYRNRVEMI